MVRISGVDTDQENLQYILKQGHTLLMDDGLLAPRYFPKLYVHLHQVVQEPVQAIELCHHQHLQQHEHQEVPGGGRGIKQREHVDTS